MKMSKPDSFGVRRVSVGDRRYRIERRFTGLTGVRSPKRIYWLFDDTTNTSLGASISYAGVLNELKKQVQS